MADLTIHELQNEATTPANDDYVVLDGATAGTRKITPANLATWIHNKWASFVNTLTTITSFASGDFIAVSNTTNGTRKMSKDTLLELTAQNALAGSVAYVEIKDKVIAAALNDLNARLAAIEMALANNNIGSVIADYINTQTLLVGGSDLEARVAAIEAILTNNNLRTAAAPAPSFTKSVPVDNIDLQVEVDKTEETETKKAIEDNIMEDK